MAAGGWEEADWSLVEWADPGPVTTGTLAEAAQAATVAFVVTNTPPAITCTLAEAGQAATVALVATNTPPAITGTLAEAGRAATVAMVATSTPPAITCTLAESAGPASVAFSIFATSITGGNLKQVVVSALCLDAAMSAILSHRISPLVSPQAGLLPAITYKIHSTHHDYTLRGPSGMSWTRIRFEARSHTHSDMVPIREVLRNRFQGLIGPLGPITVLFCEMEPEVDGYDQPFPGNDNGTYWKRMDFRFKTRETLPTYS